MQRIRERCVIFACWWRAAAAALLLMALVASPAGAQCAGDCDGDGSVTINEIITLINIALGTTGLASCPSGDTSGDGTITVDEILTAVNNALTSCSMATACGNGVIDAGEECDTPDDAQCPGRCAPPGVLGYTCHAGCGMTLGACSGPQDVSCPGQCVTLQTPGCACVPDNPPTCPTPKALPHFDAFRCEACVDVSSARLLYREELGGTLLLEKTIQFKNYIDPEHTMIAVTTTTRQGTQAPVVMDEVMQATFAVVGVQSSWLGRVTAYSVMVCGWAPGCDDKGRALIANGQQFSWMHPFTGVKYTFSCSGCGGGAGRVGAASANARCGAQFNSIPSFGLCRDSIGSLACCGCPGDSLCSPATPNCVDSGCGP